MLLWHTCNMAPNFCWAFLFPDDEITKIQETQNQKTESNHDEWNLFKKKKQKQADKVVILCVNAVLSLK